MQTTTVVVCLPIADRRASFAFYRDGLGLEPVGEPAEDGVPEPLQFALNDGLRVMLIPTGGFDRITGDHDTAPNGSSECVLTVATDTDEGVAELIHRAHAAGGTIVTAAGPQFWGYAGAFADLDGHIWMVRSEALSDLATLTRGRIVAARDGRVVAAQDGPKARAAEVDVRDDLQQQECDQP